MGKAGAATALKNEETRSEEPKQGVWGWNAAARPIGGLRAKGEAPRSQKLPYKLALQIVFVSGFGYFLFCALYTDAICSIAAQYV